MAEGRRPQFTLDFDDDDEAKEESEQTEGENPDEEDQNPVDFDDMPERDELEKMVQDYDSEFLLRDLANSFLNVPEEGEIDEETIEILSKALIEKYPDRKDLQENLPEVCKLCNELPKIFAGFREKVEELYSRESAEGSPEWRDIHHKAETIIFALTESVFRGHVTAEDLKNIVQNVTIISKDDPQIAERLKTSESESGYQSIMCYSQKERKIYLFEESLKDDFSDEKGRIIELDLEHMVNHELGHAVSAEALDDNEILSNESKKIIEEADKYKDLMPQHIRNQLNALLSIDQASPDTDKMKLRAKTEIIADFAGMYLKSNGSFEDFALSCIKKTCIDRQSTDNFINALGIADSEEAYRVQEIAYSGDKEKRIAFLTSTESLNELLVLYKTIWENIGKAISDKKGKFTGELPEEYDEDFFDGPASGFAVPENGGTNTNQKTPGGSGFLGGIVDLVKGMSQEIPNGGPATTSSAF